jgi:hypothetical protein
MIRIQFFDLPGGKRQRIYENLVAVGAPKSGETTNTDRASIQLVQFFLRKFFAKHPELRKQLPGPSGKFLLDGKVGQQTIAGIDLFQSFFRTRGFPIIEDARVSVPIGRAVPGTEKRWTIHALNVFYFLRSGETDFDSLFVNPEIVAEAPELAAELTLEEAKLEVFL